MAKDTKEATDRVAQLEQENAALHDRLANIEKLLAYQRPVITPLAQELAAEEAFQKKKAELSLSCVERTQAEARKRWKDSETEILVSVTGSPASGLPEIRIPARSKEEAKGRYDELCGILSIDTTKHKYTYGQPVPISA